MANEETPKNLGSKDLDIQIKELTNSIKVLNESISRFANPTQFAPCRLCEGVPCNCAPTCIPCYCAPTCIPCTCTCSACTCIPCTCSPCSAARTAPEREAESRS